MKIYFCKIVEHIQDEGVHFCGDVADSNQFPIHLRMGIQFTFTVMNVFVIGQVKHLIYIYTVAKLILTQDLCRP